MSDTCDPLVQNKGLDNIMSWELRSEKGALEYHRSSHFDLGHLLGAAISWVRESCKPLSIVI